MKPKPYVIGIAGPSGAGKTFLAEHLVKSLPQATIVPVDAYYPDLSHLTLAQRDKLNFDDPGMLDAKLLCEQIAELASGVVVEQPLYDFSRHTRLHETRTVQPGEYILVEGLFTLHWPELRALLHTKVFVDMDDAVCFERRLARDVRERGRTRDSVDWQFRQNVAPMCDKFVRPSAKFADVGVSGATEIADGIAAVLEHVNRPQ